MNAFGAQLYINRVEYIVYFVNFAVTGTVYSLLHDFGSQ